MNSTDHINVVFCELAHSLMRRVTASPNIIVTAIVNSNVYHQSLLIDKWESMLYVCIRIIIDRIISQCVNV